MKKYFFLLAFGLSIFPLASLAFSLNHNLKLGDQSEDVRFVQVILNQDPVTKVATNGPGSPGQETNYFGLATKAAVIRFQDKYRTDVLAPAGLTVGNGFVGPLTRLKLEQIINNTPSASSSVRSFIPSSLTAPAAPASQSAITNTPQNNPSLPLLPVKKRSSTMFIYSISPSGGSTGTKIQIQGTGFSTTSNKIYTGYNVLDDVASPDGKTLSFTFGYSLGKTMSSQARPSDYGNFPTVRQIPLGIYVENTTGVSNGALFYFTY